MALMIFLTRSIQCSLGTKKAVLFAFFFTCLLGMFVVELDRFSSRNIHNAIQPLIPAYILSLILLSLILTSSISTKIQKQILTALLVTYVFSFQLSALSGSKPIYFAAVTIFELGLLCLYLASLKSRWGFNFILLLVGIRFFALFIEALGGLAATGIGLILSGIILIALTAVWHKRRHEIARWAERIAQ
jgi:hypothetical protein